MSLRTRLSGTAVAGAMMVWGCAGLADTLDINGVARSYTVQLPATKPASLVIVLHGNTQTGADMPGSFPDARFPRIVDMLLGPQNRDIDGAETIWEFFRKFP